MALSQHQYELLKLVDKKIEHLVYGFIHKLEETSKLSTNIPLEIIKLCLLFFFNAEYFEIAGVDIVISGTQKDTITKKNENSIDNVTYGSNWIPSMNKSNYKWTLKIINNHTNNNGSVLGIIGKISDNLNRSFYDDECIDCSPCYANWGGYLSKNNKEIRSGYGINFGKPGTIITLELDLKNRELIYHFDGECYGPAFQNIQQDESTKYKFAISLYWTQAIVKLIKFECD